MNSPVKTLLGAKPCLFWGNVASGVTEVRGPARQLQQKLPTKSAQDCGRELDMHFKMLRNGGVRSTIGR